MIPIDTPKGASVVIASFNCIKAGRVLDFKDGCWLIDICGRPVKFQETSDKLYSILKIGDAISHLAHTEFEAYRHAYMNAHNHYLSALHWRDSADKMGDLIPGFTLRPYKWKDPAIVKSKKGTDTPDTIILRARDAGLEDGP